MREMVDSGVPWIGAIPKDWQVIPLKGLGRFYGGLTGKAGDDFVVNDNDYFELFVPFTNIFNNNVVQLDKLYKVKITVGEKQTLVHKGDILFLMSSEDYEGLGKPALMNDEVEKLHLNSFCKGFTPNSDVFPSFLNYYLQGQSIREYIRSNGNGFIRINLKVSKLGTTPVLLPSLPEQQRIAGFLDSNCADIDAIMEKTRASIEEYKKLKQSVITDAVTKGIRGNRTMKDSGIEWIGEMPTDWKLIPLKHLFVRRSQKNKPIISTERLSLSIDIGITKYADKTTNLDRFKDDFSQYQLAYPDDIVLNSMNMIVGAVGKSPFFGCVSPVYYVIYPRGSADVGYWSYLLNCMKIRDVYHSLGQGIYAIERGEGRVNTCRLKVPYDDFGRIMVSTPSYVEQQEIADYLDEKCATIDSLIASKEALITELEAYKKSIIYEYVTGKKQVL